MATRKPGKPKRAESDSSTRNRQPAAGRSSKEKAARVKKPRSGATKKEPDAKQNAAPVKRTRTGPTKRKNVAAKENRTSPEPAGPGTRKRTTSSDSTQSAFPIVGIGASAGGLEALQAFFKVMPPDPGLAVVVVVHLDPTQVSMLPELLQECTPLPVEKAMTETRVEVNHVYVIPPGHHLTIDRGVLLLTPRQQSGPIDYFLRALAGDRRSAAAGVILSGTGSDGTLGLRAIKGEGGATMAQNESAQYEEMPRSAVLTGQVDFILAPEKMPEQLLSYFAHTLKVATPSSTTESEHARAYHEILSLLQARTGHDFSQYKNNTIARRIERRMAVHLIDDLFEYVAFVDENKMEAHALFKELLIGVTSFFRDAAAFDALKIAIADMVRRKQDGEPFRVWVPGCSTGEEAYSIAILVHECVQAEGKRLPVHVFGTDIDEDAVDRARKGLYPASVQADITAERLRRYFSRDEGGHFQINKLIRAMLIFAVQDATKDPPFSRLDLVACRNLLIYLSANLQSHLFSVFHYSLRPRGLLFLGSSESVGTSELFDCEDRKHKLFRSKPVVPSRNTVLELSRMTDGTPARARPASLTVESEQRSKMLFRAILQHSDAPPCVVVDHEMNVVYVHGRTGQFLEPPEGTTSVNIVDMARPGLKTAIVSCVRKVIRSRKDFRQRDITLRTNGEQMMLNLVVKPILEPRALAGMSIVFFEIQKPQKRTRSRNSSRHLAHDESSVVAELRRQLVDTQESLQSTIEELETANEELKSTNEELQSTNEELQSSNEELQTSKEELQSVNEESATVNAELSSRIDDLARVNDDLKNLLDSTGVATMFLDTDCNVRRFTPAVVDLIPLASTDVGRSLSHFSTSVLDVDLVGLATAVLDDLVICEKEVNTTDGRHLLLKVRPYRTAHNVIDGTVLTFEDRTEITMAQRVLESKLENSALESADTASRLQRSKTGHKKTREALETDRKQDK